MLCALLLSLAAAAAAAAAASTSETVERVVMVRTTGSDLQPAATGFIYKKQTDGQEIVQPMHESEIERHLAKLYTGPVSSAERVIPVKEHREEPLDGLEHVDYEKLLRDYGDNHDYRDTLKRFKANLHHDYHGHSAEDDVPSEKYHYGKNHAKFESYSITDGHKDDAYKPHHYSKHGKANNDEDFHVYGTHKDDDYLGKVKFPDHEYYGGRGHKYGAYEAGHDSRGQTGGQDSAEEQRTTGSSEGHAAPKHHDQSHGHAAADARTDGQAEGRSSDAAGRSDSSADTDGRTDGKSYGYKIKH